jgi:hypothetical protein
LSCLSEICVPGQLNIGQQATQCDVIQCRNEADCQTRDTCQNAKALCDGGNTSACDDFELNCHFQCSDAGICIQECTDPLTNPLATCPAGTPVCAGSRCIQCQCDADCALGSACRGQRCWPECETNADCDGLQECNADGVCAPRDCMNDRECVSLMKDPLSVCVQATGQCARSCASDLECDEPSGFDFSACVNGICAPLGCVSDEECRAYELRNPIPGQSVQIDVCRPPLPQEVPGTKPSESECTGGTGGAGGSGGVGGGGAGGVGGNDCCVAHTTPGCADLVVESCVCAQYSGCCSSTWEQLCATLAADPLICNACGTGGSGGVGGGGAGGIGGGGVGGGGAGNGGAGNGGVSGTAGGGAGGMGGSVISGSDCCQAHTADPGCDNPTIQTCVCGFDPYCCNTNWDGTCVSRVFDNCGYTCQ